VRPYRLGAIAYTNVAPFMHALTPGDGLEIVSGVPTEMNSALLEGEVDLANISAFEFIRNADRLRALPDFSVSVLGPVYSVNLFHTLPWEELDGHTLAVTTHSATSVALLAVLMRESGVNVLLERATPDLDRLLENYPAALLIGDSALSGWHRYARPSAEAITLSRPPEDGVQVTDLAMRWFALTGKPFVFAVWASRRDDPPPPAEVVRRLRMSREWGIGHLARVSEVEAERLKLPVGVVQHYLWNFRYHLEAPDKAGLEQFAEAALPGSAAKLSFWDV
jgi:chorismate dehydratase